MLSKVIRSISILAALTAAAQADGLVTEVKVRQSGDAVKIAIPANSLQADCIASDQVGDPPETQDVVEVRPRWVPKPSRPHSK